MSKQDIIDYVMNTPYNTNRTILSQKLDELEASGADDSLSSRFFVMDIEVTDEIVEQGEGYTNYKCIPSLTIDEIQECRDSGLTGFVCIEKDGYVFIAQLGCVLQNNKILRVAAMFSEEYGIGEFIYDEETCWLKFYSNAQSA